MQSKTEIKADWLSLTVPVGHFPALCDCVRPYLDMAGFRAETADISRSGEGTVALREWMRIGYLSISGAALDALRDHSCFLPLLYDIATTLPHNVTALHAARDEYRDGRATLRSLYARGMRGEIKLSRKAITYVRKLYGASHYGGPETGTVNLGKRSASVRATVYDKRQERIEHGHPDPGDWLRIEIKLKGRQHGLTLRDAAEPAPVFYHWAAPSLCVKPAGVRDWVPMGEVLDLGPVNRPTPYARLRRRLETSAEIRSLVQLAHECGPHGLEMLAHHLQRMDVTPAANGALAPADLSGRR